MSRQKPDDFALKSSGHGLPPFAFDSMKETGAKENMLLHERAAFCSASLAGAVIFFRANYSINEVIIQEIIFDLKNKFSREIIWENRAPHWANNG
ncbi:MAG: hypothetical protein ACI4OA_03970 [Selenomonadaceae bacterium]